MRRIGTARRSPHGLVVRGDPNIVQSPLALNTWDTNVAGGGGAPTVTGGQADPLGGTSAFLIEDDNGTGGAERVESPLLQLAPLTTYVASVYVKKDAITSRVCALGLFEKPLVTDVALVKLQTNDGVAGTPAVGGFTGVVAGTIDRGAWWQLWMRVTTRATVGAGYQVVPYPAYTTTLAGSTGASGAATFWRPKLESGPEATP